MAYRIVNTDNFGRDYAVRAAAGVRANTEAHALIKAYKNTARRLCEGRAVGPGHIRVTPYAHVQVCEDGAFVEAVVWIPKEEIE